MHDILLILNRCGLRHWRYAWRQQLMLLAILALGTAVHVAMRLANRSALAGFERFTEGITHQPDWTVQSPAGCLQEAWLREMRAALGNRPVTLLPVIEATVVPDMSGEAANSVGSRPTWRLLGMDLIALQNLRATFALRQGPGEADERAGFASEAMAAQQSWIAGSKLKIVVNDEVVSLTLGGTLPILPDAPTMPDNLILTDLPEAQRLLHRQGQIDRVEVLAAGGPAFPHLHDDAARILNDCAKNRWYLSDHEDRHALAGSMTEAFRLNLTVLSLLALLVGGYLMFQALDGVVIRRREEIAVLRALGVTACSVQGAFLVEAALLGLIAGVLGVLLGWAGAQGAVLGVARTMTAIYGASSATYATLSAGEAGLGVALCVTASLIAAWWPARVAARTPAAQVLSRHPAPWQGGKVWRAGWLGLLLCALAVALAQIGPVRLASSRLPLAAYAAALCWLLGAGLAAGGLLRFFPIDGSAAARVAFSHIRLPSVRHRFAVAALTSAMAMTCGMAIMIASFDHTMRSWITRSMKADIYVSSAGAQSASSTHLISASTVESIRSQPGVQELAVLQHAPVSLPDGMLHVLGGDMEFNQRLDLQAWVQEPLRDWWREQEPAALINESLGERLQKQRGDMLDLPTPAGTKRVRIAGVFADYGNERGSALLPGTQFRDWFHTDNAWRVAIMLKPGADPEAARTALQRRHPGLNVFTQKHLRSEALRIFRQTFAVTYALEAVGVIVAVAGLGLALASLMLDRRHDLTTLRAIGFTRRDVAGTCAWEGFGLALAGVVAGMFSGLWLGWLLIERVNKQSFGWTLSFDFPALQITALAGAVLGVGVIVAALVGRSSSWLQVEREE